MRNMLPLVLGSVRPTDTSVQCHGNLFAGAQVSYIIVLPPILLPTVALIGIGQRVPVCLVFLCFMMPISASLVAEYLVAAKQAREPMVFANVTIEACLATKSSVAELTRFRWKPWNPDRGRSRYCV